MTLTNRYQLPDIFCESVALFESDYDREDSDFTATELVRPVRISVLSKKHWNELEEDVSDRVWSLSGQVKHLIFQRLAEKNPERYIAEKRMKATVDGWKVSGRLDLYDRQTSILYDWKETKIFKIIKGDSEDWEAQANINRYCLMKSQWSEASDKIKSVSALKNLVLLRDWNAREAERRQDYPRCAIHVVDLQMWSDAKCEQYIRERIEAYNIALEAEHRDKPLPLCTPDERWQDPEQWAVMKKGRKRAVKLHDDEHIADMHVHSLGAGHYVEHRPSEPKRCLRYCQVAKFCDFGRRALGLPELSKEVEYNLAS